MKRNSFIHSLYSLVLILMVFSSCERRSLEDGKAMTALVPFTIDWSKSGLDLSEMRRASIWFFPHDGSHSFEWRMQEDFTHTVVPLSVGKYSIVVFNETVDVSDWDAILFDGMESYETFSVYTRKSDFTGLYTRTDEVDIRKTPETLAWWSIADFEITSDMIAYTNKRTTRSEKTTMVVTRALDGLAKITPIPLTVQAHIQAHIQNLKSALRCSAAFSGATGRVSLATGLPMAGTVTHVFVMNNRKYDTDNPLNGTIEANLLLFRFWEAAAEYRLQLDFELHGGVNASSEVFDITRQVDKVNTSIQINVGVEDNEHDHLIILPNVDLENEVGVDHWDNIEIPLG